MVESFALREPMRKGFEKGGPKTLGPKDLFFRFPIQYSYRTVGSWPMAYRSGATRFALALPGTSRPGRAPANGIDGLVRRRLCDMNELVLSNTCFRMAHFMLLATT